MERFSEVIVGTLLQARSPVIALSESGEHQDRDLSRFRFFPHLPENVEAGYSGHHHVKDHDIGIGGEIEGPSRIGAGDDLKSLGFKNLDDEIDRRGIIINHENRRHESPS